MVVHPAPKLDSDASRIFTTPPVNSCPNLVFTETISSSFNSRVGQCSISSNCTCIEHDVLELALEVDMDTDGY